MKARRTIGAFKYNSFVTESECIIPKRKSVKVLRKKKFSHHLRKCESPLMKKPKRDACLDKNGIIRYEFKSPVPKIKMYNNFD